VTSDSQQRPYSSAVAVERAADLLFLIAERGEASLTDLARAIGSSGSAVHRILTALKNKGLIQQSTENGPYSMSWSILALTQRLTAQTDLRSLSLPFMTELRDLTGETVTLNVRSGFDRVCIDQVEGPHEVSWRQDIGKISPLYGGATGKVLLAYLEPEELKAFWRTVKMQKLTPYTVTSREELLKEIELIRNRGYAFGTQDRLIGVAGIAAPIFDSSGHAAATLTIAGPADRCTSDRLEQWVEPLTAATQKISQYVADAAFGTRPPARSQSEPALVAGASAGH
jgi:DNA-binding IclR family transcriptional regulator